MIPIYDRVIFSVFQKIIEKSISNHFFFISHKKAHQQYLRWRSVCKLWNEILLMMLPRRTHLKILPHNETAFESKIAYMERSDDLSLYFKSHITIFCANKCAIRKLHTVSELFSTKITRLFVEELPCPDGIVPVLLTNLKNLQELHISRSHWSTKFKFESTSLQTIALQSCLGMKTMKMACPSLSSFVFDRGILGKSQYVVEIPFLEDIGERKLRFIIQSTKEVNIVVKGLNLNNLKIHCNTPRPTHMKLSKCLGITFKFSSRLPMDVTMRKCYYSAVVVDGEKVDRLQMVNMKMKVLKLRCPILRQLHTNNCVIKTRDFICPLLDSPDKVMV